MIPVEVQSFTWNYLKKHDGRRSYIPQCLEGEFSIIRSQCQHRDISVCVSYDSQTNRSISNAAYSPPMAICKAHTENRNQSNKHLTLTSKALQKQGHAEHDQTNEKLASIIKRIRSAMSWFPMCRFSRYQGLLEQSLRVDSV